MYRISINHLDILPVLPFGLPGHSTYTSGLPEYSTCTSGLAG
jgi:hypothetical protein